MSDIEKITDKHGYGFLTDVFMFLKDLEENDISPVDFLEWMGIDRKIREETFKKNREHSKAMRKIYEAKAPKCDVCGKVMGLEAINNIPSRMIDDHSKSWWFCPDINCEGDPITDDRAVLEIHAEFGLKIQPVYSDHEITRRRRLAYKAKQAEINNR